MILSFLYGSGVLAVVLSVTFIIFTSYVAYVHRKYAHIPSPKMPSFYTGHLADLSRIVKYEVPFPEIINYWLQSANSHTFIVFFVTKPMLVTADPEAIKIIMMDTKNNRPKRIYDSVFALYGKRYMGNGLFSVTNYDTWKPQKKMFDPAFKKSYLKTLTSTFQVKTNSIIKEMKPLADGKTVVPLKKFIMKLALEIISEAAFGTDFSKLWTADSLGVAIPKGSDSDVFSYLANMSFQALYKTLMTPYPHLQQYLHPIEGRTYRSVMVALRKIGRDCVMRRIKMIQNGEDVPKDILSFMLSSENEEVEIEELVDNFITFFVAGQETSANNMMFSLLLLVLHPNILERTLQEISEVLGDREDITSEDVEQLQYLEQVVYESLRLYPPVPVLYRTINSTSKIGGYLVPAGIEVMIEGSNMCRMSEYFDEPDEFNPDRFNLDNKKPSSFVFFPFGVGHRSCIGKHFAIMEVKIALARFLQTFKFHFPEDYEIKVIQRTTQQPKDDLLCTLTRN